MKFEFEKLSVKYIERRVAEEEAARKDGRKVTTVTLTSKEWYELIRNEGMAFGSFPSGGRDEIVFSPRVPYKIEKQDEYVMPDFRTIRIVREGY